MPKEKKKKAEDDVEQPVNVEWKLEMLEARVLELERKSHTH